MSKKKNKTKSKEKEKVSKKLDEPLGLEEACAEIGEALDMAPVNLSRSKVVENALKTGSLTLDLLSGGGYPPGAWVTIRGESGTGKSTLGYSSIGNAVDWKCPVFFFDHEGSTSPSYLEKIMRKDLTTILGKVDDKGNFVVKPLMRYYQPQLGEGTFRYIRRIMAHMPDKKERNGKWYLVYSNDWKKELQAGGYTFIQKKNKLFVETTSGGPQAVFFIDSLAYMLPEARDEKDEASPMAKLARMLSDSVPLIKPKLAPKRCIVVAMNQMRQKPMAMGNPRYEVGGETVKYAPDAIIDLWPVSLKTAGINQSGIVLEEPCWDNVGKDRYKFTKVTIEKNKNGPAYRSFFMKIWFETKAESGYGLCPVHDCKTYLEETGQLDETKKTFTISMEGPWAKRQWTDHEFKELILNPDKLDVYKKYELKDSDIIALRKEIKKAPKKKKEALIKKLKKLCAMKLDIRAACAAQIVDGSAFTLYASSKVDGKAKAADDDDDEDDDDDDFGDED